MTKRIFLLAWLWAAAAFAADPEVVSSRGKKVVAVEFSGDALPANAHAKFASLANRDFSPSAIRSALLWYHENGGDSLLQVNAVDRGEGLIALKVEAHQRRKIGEVVFEGNHTTSSATLQQQIELKDGVEFEPEAAQAASQKIILYYSKLGYLASDVKYLFDTSTKILKFIVSEGEPTLISGIEISPLTSVERKDLRQKYESEIYGAFALRTGDRIQRDKVLDGIQAVKDWLRDHDFLTARDPALEYKVSEDGKVRIILDIAYGPRIRYGFRGNHQFSFRELNTLVSEVKEIASGGDYLSSVRRRVLEAYKEIGFANAKITTLVRDDNARGIRYVSLIVNEGTKIRVEKLEIEGIFSMNKEDARDKFRSFGTRLVQRNYFDEIGITRAADLFAEYLRSQGYLSARMEYVKTDFNEDHTKVKVSVLFSEGIQTRVQKVELMGVKSFPTSEVLEIFGLKEGEPFDIFAFEKGLQTIKDKYQEIGNLSAQIVNEASDSIVKYSKDNTQVFIHVEVDEGPTYRVGDIVVRGNKQTHARVVLRELPFISGDVLTSPLLNEAEDNLRTLNLFGQVIVRPIDHPGAEDVKDILILIDEVDPGTFDIVPGFRNDLGMRLGFEVGYQNLGGWNRSVNASAVFNRRFQNYYGREGNGWKTPEYNFSVGFKEPYLAEWPVVFTSNLNFLKRQYPSFDAKVRRLVLGVKRALTRYLSGFLEYGYEQVEISNVLKGSSYETDDPQRYIGSVTPGFVIDSRNNKYTPTGGIYSVNRLEVASKIFASEENVGYTRASSYNSTYFRLFEDVVLALAVNVGWQRSNLPQQPIPSYKLFRLGGLSSIRGYNEDGIAADISTDKAISGALGMLNYRGELRIPIMGSFGTALFLDAGNLFIDRFNFDPNQLRSSVGTGLRYNTAVGPVLLDFAWRLQSDPKVGDTCVTGFVSGGVGREATCLQQPTDRYKIHFAIGIF